MTFQELSAQINISETDLREFIKKFSLSNQALISENNEPSENFINFAAAHKDFLTQFSTDLHTAAENTAIPKVADKSKTEELHNQGYTTHVSGIYLDYLLGNNYNFIYDYFGGKSPIVKGKFIGYDDLYLYILDLLEPFINTSEAKNWGMRKPAGILLYGAPGTGKIFWARKIAELLHVDLNEIRKFSIISSSEPYKFGIFLDKMLSQTKKNALFIEDFDEILKNKTAQTDEFSDALLSEISKFPENDILLLAGCQTISALDEALLAPGRMDLQIPVFPPNAQERSQMILYFLTTGLDQDSILYQILQKSGAMNKSYWDAIAVRMKCYSNTMIEDFVQSLKKRIRKAYAQNHEYVISAGIMEAALRDASTKLTSEYLDKIDQFLIDVSLNNYDDFPERTIALQTELNAYKIPQKPLQAIGFHHNSEK